MKAQASSPTGSWRGGRWNETNGYDIRIDQYIGSKNQLFGRWSWKNLPFQAQANLGLSQLLSRNSWEAVGRIFAPVTTKGGGNAVQQVELFDELRRDGQLTVRFYMALFAPVPETHARLPR
jgi:hypothetical protein